MPYKNCNAMMQAVRVGNLVAAVCITVCCIHRSQTCLFKDRPQEILCIYLCLLAAFKKNKNKQRQEAQIYKDVTK